MGIDLNELFKKLPNKELLSIFEVAAFLGTTKRTVYNWYPHILDGTNLNGSIRIFRTAVVAFVIENRGKKRSDEIIEEVEQKTKKPMSKHRNASWVKNWSAK